MKWQVGMQVRLKYPRSSQGSLKPGMVGRIRAIEAGSYRWIDGKVYDYECIVDYDGDGGGRHVFEQLEPLTPPKVERGSWTEVEKLTGWNPTKEPA